jgi:prolipoprotein diacylglyceryl transferase
MIVWDVNPVLIHLGPLQIRWYGVFFAAALVLAYIILQKIIYHEGNSFDKIETLLFCVLIGIILGARLGHCFFYNPSYYLGHPLEILKFWKGGLASHGGAIGILVVLIIFARTHPEFPFLWLLDRLCLVAGLSGFFIRLGNLFNSEIIGTPTTLPWGVVFKRVDHLARHPVQVYESLAYGIIFLILLGVYHRTKDKMGSGLISGLFFVLVFTVRFLLEFVKVRQAEYSTTLPLSTGQLLSIPFCAAGIGLIIYSITLKKEAFSVD